MRKGIMCAFSLILLVGILTLPTGAASPYTDVPEDHWAYDGIVYTLENGLMNGTGKGRFSPDQYFSRAMFVTILGRMEGIETDAYPGSTFSDVPEGHWAAPYIQWASENGIVNGVGKGRFLPDTTITMEQYCTIICRYMDQMGHSFPGEHPYDVVITDAGDIRPYALVSAVRMADYALVDLYPDGSLIPEHWLCRGDIADLFTRFHKMLTANTLPGLDDPGTRFTQSGNDIVRALQEASAVTWDWFYVNTYTDKENTIQAYSYLYNGNADFERVIHPYVHSVQDLKDLCSRYFDYDLVDSLGASKQVYEQDDALYLSAVDGIGGPFPVSCHMDIIQEAPDRYELQIFVDLENEEQFKVQVNYLYNGSRWVFDAPVPVGIQSVPISLVWG